MLTGWARESAPGDSSAINGPRGGFARPVDDRDLFSSLLLWDIFQEYNHGVQKGQRPEHTGTLLFSSLLF